MQPMPKSVPHGPLMVTQQGVPKPLLGQNAGLQVPMDDPPVLDDPPKLEPP